jgi:hypothetical protein
MDESRTNQRETTQQNVPMSGVEITASGVLGKVLLKLARPFIAHIRMESGEGKWAQWSKAPIKKGKVA